MISLSTRLKALALGLRRPHLLGLRRRALGSGGWASSSGPFVFRQIRGISEQGKLVANNMTIVLSATTELAEAETLTVDNTVDLHRSLIPDEPHHHGLRAVQNWIGTLRWTPIGATFVPPGPERVPGYMADLVDYMNGSAHAPLIQAAVVHAQFETIHPFTEGNGRVGRALIHTVLARRGLTERAVLPVSLVLATSRDRYVEGLTEYRHAPAAGSAGASRPMNAWTAIFIEAEIAVTQSEAPMDAIHTLRAEWTDRLTAHRSASGVRPTPRADSTVSRLLGQLPEAPPLDCDNARQDSSGVVSDGECSAGRASSSGDPHHQVDRERSHGLRCA